MHERAVVISDATHPPVLPTLGWNSRGIRVTPRSGTPQTHTSSTNSAGWSQRCASLLGIEILATGSYVPERIVSNAELETVFGCDSEWIEQRTGILARRYASPEQATSDLCIAAARHTLETAGVAAEDVDLLIVGTFTPDYPCPSTANLVQAALNIDAPAMDVQAACAGFMYALLTAAQFIATGTANLALVIGGDCNSRIVNPQDQKVVPLFGDGAGAVLLRRGDPHQGMLCYQLGSDGGGAALLDRKAGGTRQPATPEAIAQGLHFLQMDGRNVFKWAVKALRESIALVLSQAGLSVNDVHLYVLHQANIRIINSAIEQLGIDPNRVYNNLQQYGNTSAGSIPLALDEAHRQGRIQRGDLVVLSGFGAGLSWGTALIRW
ncbi:MAG: 3-oxoacyl-[acyl-carrier-protein] synthase 3 [Planctomycetaceae bacterium]|nr:MAG: 3-oxoacyl-[acyl-carrier-protein] synthase 3 [Planctomycetaceae bacterium]